MIHVLSECHLLSSEEIDVIKLSSSPPAMSLKPSVCLPPCCFSLTIDTSVPSSFMISKVRFLPIPLLLLREISPDLVVNLFSVFCVNCISNACRWNISERNISASMSSLHHLAIFWKMFELLRRFQKYIHELLDFFVSKFSIFWT